MRLIAFAAVLLLAGCSAPAGNSVVESQPAASVSEEAVGATGPEESQGSQESAGDQLDPEESSSPEPSAEKAATTQTKESSQPSQNKSPEPTVTAKSKPTPTATQTPSPTPEPTVTTGPVGYTRAEVAAKNTRSACWVIVDGSVYDLTRWITQHPGGAAPILALCGTDASDAFDAQHAGQARPSSTLNSYFLGPLID